MNDAARLRARVLLRQRWRAAVALGVVAAEAIDRERLATLAAEHRREDTLVG